MALKNKRLSEKKFEIQIFALSSMSQHKLEIGMSFEKPLSRSVLQC